MTTSKSEETSGATDSRFNQDVYSQVVRAGKRTYFFDVKCTRNNEYYLTITESKRRVDKDGKFVYDKHKIFLYKEDFEKFSQGLEEMVNYIREKIPASSDRIEKEVVTPSFSDVNFEEL